MTEGINLGGQLIRLVAISVMNAGGVIKLSFNTKCTACCTAEK